MRKVQSMKLFSPRRAVAAMALVLTLLSFSVAKGADQLRPPAYPLVACDPYFSVWSFTDQLAESFPVHWTGNIHALTCFARIDGQKLRLMGNPVEYYNSARAMRQTEVQVRATNTTYTCGQDGAADRARRRARRTAPITKLRSTSTRRRNCALTRLIRRSSRIASRPTISTFCASERKHRKCS